jgi:hypothetical protein
MIAICTIVEQPGMHDELPFRTYLRVSLACSAKPVEIFAVPIAPQGVDIDYRECAIALL